MAINNSASINRWDGPVTPGQSITLSLVGGFIDRSHVLAYDYEPSTRVFTPTPFTWINDSTITGITVPAGHQLVVRRQTPDLPLVDFVSGSRLSAVNLDTASRQAILRASEGVDVANMLDTIDLMPATKQAVQDSEAAAALAQDWATKVGAEVVVGQGYSAKQYSLDAQASANAASGSASAASGSAAAASDSAAAAAGSASAAAGSASAASGSASAASGSTSSASGYATAAITAMGFAEAARDAAEDYRDEAQTQATNAASAVSAAAATWVANASYTVNKLVWLTGSSGRLFRCITAHSGRSATPDADPTYWVEVGAIGVLPAGWKFTADATTLVFRRPDDKTVGYINTSGVFTAGDVARNPGLPS